VKLFPNQIAIKSLARSSIPLMSGRVHGLNIPLPLKCKSLSGDYKMPSKISPRPAGGAGESLHNSIRPSQQLQTPARCKYSCKTEPPKTGGQLQFVGKCGAINTKETRAKEEKR